MREPGADDPARATRPRRQLPAHLPLRTRGGWRLRRRYLRAFARARQRIHIAHGYFLPDRGVVRAITAASNRGVEVRLLLAGRSDVPFARAATRSLYRRLLEAGVSIHEWGDSVLHAKVATVDGRRLLVGSFNLDPFSLANLETLVEVADPRIVAEGEDWIQDHFAGSTAMSSVQASSALQRWLLEPFGRLVARGVDAIARVVGGRRRSQGAHQWFSSLGHRSRPHRRTGREGARRLRAGRSRALDQEVRSVATSLRFARTAVVALLGSSILLLGVALLVLPGPAAVVIPLGLAILATEFVWAGTLLRSARRHLGRLKLRAEHLLRRPPPSRESEDPP